MGAIAEFIIHVYLKSLGTNQACCYKNLEEKSPKNISTTTATIAITPKTMYVNASSASASRIKIDKNYQDIVNYSVFASIKLGL